MSEEKEEIGRELTPKQKQFCEEYLIDLNATQAAIRAGYSPKTAQEQSSRLLSNVIIATELQKLFKARGERLKLDQDWVLKRFMDISDRCMEARPEMEYDPVNKEMVQKTNDEGELLFTFDSAGANRATEMIAKHLGFFEKNNEQKRPVAPPQINMLPLKD